MANLAIGKNIVQDLVMAVDRSAPIVDDPWLGPLWRYNDHELIGWITIDPAVRHARHDGSTDAEVLLNIGTFPQPSADLDARVSIAAQRIKTALANLDAINSSESSSPLPAGAITMNHKQPDRSSTGSLPTGSRWTKSLT